MKTRKMKLLAVAGVALIAVVAGGVIAWLNGSATARHEITTGKVDIRLVEDAWDAGRARNLRPNAVLERDPRVKNVGANDAYVFVTLEMAALPEGTALHSGTGMARSGLDTPLFTTQAGSGLAYDNAHWTLVTRSVRNGRITQVYGYAHNNEMTPLKRNEITPPVFERLRLANAADSAALQGVSTAISVAAYAIQTTELGKQGDAVAPLEVWNIVANYHQSRG